MDWERFDTRGEDKHEAFEAFVCQLFERYCRRTFGSALQEVRYVNGSGGDGGVEAYALIRRADASQPDVVGMQAKWFRDSLSDTQLKQINRSFETAKDTHRPLKRYIVAIPRKLGDKRRGTKVTERDLWARHIDSFVERWDEASLAQELAEPENEGLHAYWFTSSIFTSNDLEKRFHRAKGGWLRNRYFPALHAPMYLEQDLAFRLGAPAIRKKLLDEVDLALALLRQTRNDLARLPRYPTWGDLPDAPKMLEGALRVLGEVECRGEELREALRNGRMLPNDWSTDNNAVQQSLRLLERALKDLDAKTHHAVSPTHDVLRQLSRYLASRVTFQIWERWNWLRGAHLLVAYQGPPGVGKTHGLARAVEQCFKEGCPALLLRARDCPVEEDWGAIFQKALDRPTMSLKEAFQAMEATAIRADVRRSREARGEGDDIGPGPTYFLLAIDGLDESFHHRRAWADRLGELTQHLDEHPRIRAAVTLRATSADEILDRMRKDRFQTLKLEVDDNEIDQLLEGYCRYYRIDPPDHRLRWALRDRLSVRLYCELKQQLPNSAFDRSALSLPQLIATRIKLCEQEIRERLGHSRYDDPLQVILKQITDAAVDGRSPRREQIIELAAEKLPGFQQWSAVLDLASEQGILLWVEPKSSDRLERAIIHVEAAYEPLLEYLIAKQASDRIADVAKVNPSTAGAIKLPASLRYRHDAITQMAIILLSKHGISILRAELFQSELRDEERERLELRAIAALDNNEAFSYADWVRQQLCASMPSCRRVLKELCMPVARDPSHPLGPRFVHEVLVPFLPAKRDLFWSGPHILPGNAGQPWEGVGDEALEHLSLRDDDVADGPPLLLAWALTSVDNRWRAQLRAELSRWGGRNVTELVRWLDIVTESNDPQMLEDVAMVAFGAAILAGRDPLLKEVARWVDTNWLKQESSRRREDIVVLHAARGVIERANAAGISLSPETVSRTKSLYRTTNFDFPLDIDAAAKSDSHHGIHPIRNDLAWYVVPSSIRSFLRGNAFHDQVAASIADKYRVSSNVKPISPTAFAFGAVAAHLQNAGWNDNEFYGRLGNDDERIGMDIAIIRRYFLATQGERSPVCAPVEKYVWTGCHALQAFLAAHMDPKLDPVEVAHLPSNPAFDVPDSGKLEPEPWWLWADEGLNPPTRLDAAHQVQRSLEWMERAPLPSLEPWLLPSRDSLRYLDSGDWLTLHGTFRAQERDAATVSYLQVWSAVVPPNCVELIKNDANALRVWPQRIFPRYPNDFVESIKGRTYKDPREIVWAPWGIGENSEQSISLKTRSNKVSNCVVKATTAQTYWESYGETRSKTEERYLVLPAGWIRSAIPLLDARPHGDAWRLLDRNSQLQAIYTSTPGTASANEVSSRVLLMRRKTLDSLLHSKALAFIWLCRLTRWIEPSIRQFIADSEKSAPRTWEWIGTLTNGDIELVPLTPEASEAAPAS